MDCGRRKHKAHRPYLLTRYFPEDGNESQIQWSGFVDPDVMRDAGRQATLQLNFCSASLGFVWGCSWLLQMVPVHRKRHAVIVEKLYIIRYTIITYDRNAVGELLYCYVHMINSLFPEQVCPT